MHTAPFLNETNAYLFNRTNTFIADFPTHSLQASITCYKFRSEQLNMYYVYDRSKGTWQQKVTNISDVAPSTKQRTPNRKTNLGDNCAIIKLTLVMVTNTQFPLEQSFWCTWSTCSWFLTCRGGCCFQCCRNAEKLITSAFWEPSSPQWIIASPDTKHTNYWLKKQANNTSLLSTVCQVTATWLKTRKRNTYLYLTQVQRSL